MKQYKIELPENLTNYIEKLNYELNSITSVMKSFLEFPEEDIKNNIVYEDYKKNQFEAFSKYEIAKTETLCEYVPIELMMNNHNYNWKIFFAKNILILNVHCNCGIKICDEYYAGRKDIKII